MATLVCVQLLLFGQALWDGSALIGREFVDAYGTQWFYAWVGRALEEGSSFARARDLFAPWGKDVLGDSGGNVLDALVAVPFRRLLGPVLGYNLFVVVCHALGGWACFRFVREVTGDGRAAGLAAVVLLLQPFPLIELAAGRPTQALLVLMVLFFHLLWRTTTRAGLLSPVLAGLVLALLSYQYWFYGLFAGVAGVAFGVGALFGGRNEGGGRGLAKLALAALVACGVAAPVALPLLRGAANQEVPGLLRVSTWGSGSPVIGTEAGGAVTLEQWQPAVGWLGFLVNGEGEHFRFLPLEPLAAWPLAVLLVVFVSRRGPLSRAAVVGAVVAATVIAVGPVWVVGSSWFWNPVYVEAAQLLPFLRRLHWPARAVAVVGVLSPVVFGVVLARVRRRPWLQMGVGLVVVGAQLAALNAARLLPFPSWTPRLEAGYLCLAQADAGGVVELPWSWSQRHLVAQELHGRPILGGMNERDPSFAPPELLALAASNRLVDALTDPNFYARTAPLEFDASELAELGGLGYRWIVYQLDANHVTDRSTLGASLLSGRQGDAFRRWQVALGEPVYTDARMMIWAPWGHGSPCAGAEPAADLAPLGRTEVPVGFRLGEAISF